MDPLVWLAWIFGLLMGAAAVWLGWRSRLAGRISQLENEKKLAELRLADTASALAGLKEEREKLHEQVVQLTAELSESRTQVVHLQKEVETQLQHAQSLHEKLQHGFEVLAGRIVEEKGKKLSEQHQKELETMLQPFRDRLSELQRMVSETYDKEKRDVLSLKEQVRLLHEQSQRMEQETLNLTRALRGDTRQQGKWGELILERILEFAGLQKELEYDLQRTLRNRRGEQIRPDAVVYLPDQKHLIIDAKVSLNAYERLVSSETDEEKKKALADHILAIRQHVKDLSDKDYYTSEELKTPEMVVMFVPVEPAFMEALRSDSDLFSFAWERRIALVGPSTLLATLRTVASLWKIEKQNRNAQEIARLSGKLYDKLCGVLTELDNLGSALRKAEDEYVKFRSGLTSERDNVLKLAERIRSMGASTTKTLPAGFRDGAGLNDEPEALPSPDGQKI